MELTQEEKIKLRDGVYRIIMSDLEYCIHDLPNSEGFWEGVSDVFPHIDLDNNDNVDVILKELDTYQFGLGMKLK